MILESTVVLHKTGIALGMCSHPIRDLCSEREMVSLCSIELIRECTEETVAISNSVSQCEPEGGKLGAEFDLCTIWVR